jgi:transcriptional antiterminator RfaH
MLDVACSSRGWLVVNTHPHREKLAMDNLARQNFETYCPQIRKTVRAQARAREVLRPLFPNYLFVHLDPQERARWRPILSTYGVRRLIRFGDQTPSLDPAFVDALRAREVDGAVVKPPVPYEVGQEVCIAGGSFDGVVARILQIDPHQRLTVLMELLGQTVRGRIHADQVSPARAP